ncbi:MAG: hypothetical protein EOO89_33355 [Pedobacter sp.]|nr:MAG: hypothetical protein EOO89_33355 [Pedobacter sp.]
MKKLLIYGFMSLFLISSCRKSDNVNVPDFIKVPLPTVKKVSGDPTISSQNPDGFTAKYSVGLYFPDGDKPAKFDVVVIKNNNVKVVKLLQADVTTYPTELTVTGLQLKALFGASVALGDRFDIGVDITLSNGKKYLAFPEVGVAYGAGVASPAGSSTTTRYEAVCTFKMSDYGAIGTVVPYTVIADKWADYGPGETVDVTIIDATHLSFTYPASNALPIVVTVNPANNTTSVAAVNYGNYGSQYFRVDSDPTSSLNTVSPCELTFSVALRQYELPATKLPPGTLYGTYPISFKKK